MLSGILNTFGVLRLCLLSLVVLLIALSPFTGTTVRLGGVFDVITTLLAPAFYVVFVFVLPLDMVMTRVFMSAKSETDRRRLAKVFWTEVVLFVALVLAWLPFLLALTQTR